MDNEQTKDIKAQRHTIVFNDNADQKQKQRKPEKSPYFFPKDYEKNIFKETWFETTLWLVGILALMVAVCTIIN
jgi:hypothetical protein